MRRINAAAIGATILLMGTLSFGDSTPLIPQRLSETGLYRDGSVDPRNRPFSPQYPLWSDGAAKSRWIRLPEGAKIDVTDVDAWRFPAGTTIWKEFAWNGRKVETRMIRAEDAGKWTFAAYVWTEDQTDAMLAPAEGVPAAFEVAPGKRHSIPSIQDCNACHSSAPTAVLGFNALQLSDDRDPLAPHAEAPRPGDLTLSTLVEEDRLEPPRPDLAQQPPRIRENNPTARAAMGYLSANCGACHNSRGPLARLGFSLLHDAGAEAGAPEPARATAVAARGRFVVPGASEELSRIVSPGAPELSAVLHRMKSRRPASQMPPLGTVIADDEAVALVQKWIEGEKMEPLP
jgi:mono/diheme cytochrome c family protein